MENNMDERIEINGNTEWFIEFAKEVGDLMHNLMESSKKIPDDSDVQNFIERVITLLLKAEGEIARLNTEKINQHLERRRNNYRLVKEPDFLYHN